MIVPVLFYSLFLCYCVSLLTISFKNESQKILLTFLFFSAISLLHLFLPVRIFDFFFLIFETGAESMRSSILGFDRVIFCTGFRFKLADPPKTITEMTDDGKYITKSDNKLDADGNVKPDLFHTNVRPELDRMLKYPKQNYDYGK